MTNEELKALFQGELKAFKESLPSFVDEAGMKTALENFKSEMEKTYENVAQKADFAKLEKAIEEQGIAIASIEKGANGGEKEESFKTKLQSAIKAFGESKGEKQYFATTNKSVYSTNFTDDTAAYRASGVGEIKRGVPFMRDLFQIVNIGSDSHDTIRWFEQLAVTNNAANAAEVRNAAGMSQSNLTWVEKNLSSKRIHDFIKVSVDRIKDVAFVEGEVRRLIERNMRLKENDQLINGLGTGNEIAGLLSYATAFDTTGISIQDANLIDLLGKIKTQIDTNMLGAAMPNNWIANRVDVDAIRYKKDANNQYLFQNWALGSSDVNVAGMNAIENPLMTANTLLAGDFSLATLYVWDDLVIEMYYEGTDKRDGLVTIGAYMRENLRVQDVDTNAFVKVADLASDIATITTPVA